MGWGKMAENFTHAKVEAFAWKMCTRLLFSKCNKRRLQSYNKALTKEDHDAMIAKENESDARDDDYIQEISDPKDDKIPKKVGKIKRKRGRPRKIVDPVDPNPIVQQFATEAIAERVQKKKNRVTRLGPLQKSPYKDPYKEF
ncbi:unnamed protein product [Urochloa humidicola]